MNISKPEHANIEEYIKSFPEDVQEVLNKLRKVIEEEIPNIQESIAYNMPTFKLNDQLVLHIGAYKNHVSLFGISSKEYKQELDSYLKEKGTIQFQLDQEVPYVLVKKLLEGRVKEINK